MATHNGQRVAAFLLALLFLVTTVAATGFVLWELSRSSEDTEISEFERAQQALADGQQNEPVTEEPPVDDTAELLENFEPPVTVSELRYEIIQAGEGEEVQTGDTVTIHYTGALASNGRVFDSSVSRGEPATFPLGSLIQGWQQGIPGMKIGEKRRLFIPSDLGYGPGGSPPSIPGDADLIFDIELFATTR